MPWRRSYNRSFVQPYVQQSRPIWQQAGETMTLGRACAQYGVTKEQVQEADIRTQWRSFKGNSYEVVVIDDIIALKSRLAAQVAAAKEKKLKEEMGAEAYNKWKQQQADQEARRKDRLEQSPKIQKLLEKIMEVNAKDSSIHMEGIKIATGVAKKIWGVGQAGEGEKSGRSTVYNLTDIIRASVELHESSNSWRRGTLLERLQKNGDAKAKNQYAAYLRWALDDYESDFVEQVISEQAKVAKDKMKKAEYDLKTLEAISADRNEEEEEEAGEDDEDDEDKVEEEQTDDVDMNDEADEVTVSTNNSEEESTKKEETEEANQTNKKEDSGKPKYALKTKISKKFPGFDKPFEGTIESFDPERGFYHIKYEDGDEEDLTERQVDNCFKNSKKRKAKSPKAVVSPTPRKRRAVAAKVSYKEEDGSEDEESEEDEESDVDEDELILENARFL